MGHLLPSSPSDRPIASSRKILCTACLLASALGAFSNLTPNATASPPQPLRARLSQAGRRLVFSLRTERPVALAQLDRQPRSANASDLCFELRARGQAGRWICLGGGHGASRRAGLVLLNATGEPTNTSDVAARLTRPEPDKLVLALLPSDADLTPRHYSWRVIARQGHCGQTKQSSHCEASLPAHGSRRFRLRPVRATGCTNGGTGLITNGPRERDVVALTFDDGPSIYTPGFLQVLREKHVAGTFFEIGQEMSRYPSTMRQILRQGDEIGNHTMHHTEFPGYAAIAPATTLAESITHFRPCLFRPPGGAVNSSVIAAAGEDGLSTVTWDVDPADWSNPGSAAVYSRVVGAARPGSIILMHDGGGDRSGSLAALPQIIDTLRARGYGFATVTGLLGQRTLYKPYG